MPFLKTSYSPFILSLVCVTQACVCLCVFTQTASKDAITISLIYIYGTANVWRIFLFRWKDMFCHLKLLFKRFALKALNEKGEKVMNSNDTQSILDSPSDRRKHFSLMDDSRCYLLTGTWPDVPRGVALKSLPLTLSVLWFNQGPGNQMR